MERGGYADKLGGRYEDLWAVRQLLHVLAGELHSIEREPVGPDGAGVDLWITERTDIRVCQQCKLENRSKNSWSMGDLADRGVLAHLRRQLERSPSFRFTFVSAIAAHTFQDLCRSARDSRDTPSFYEHQVKAAKSRLGAFVKFCHGAGLSPDNERDRERARSLLQRSDFYLFQDAEEERRQLRQLARNLVDGDPQQVLNELESWARSQLRRKVDTRSVASFLRHRGLKLLRARPAAGGAETAPPELPLNYVERRGYLEPLRRSVLDRSATTLGITGEGKTGLQGMGGIGKTVLATALARDPEVRKTFRDGIYWLTIRQAPDLLALQRQLADAAGSREVLFADLQEGKRHLSSLFSRRRVLLVLDDVWEPEHAEVFDVVKPPGRLLITTRHAEVISRLGATDCRLDRLSPKEARRFLARWTEQPETDLPDLAARVADACGYLPLALAMIGALVKQRETGWEDALTRLRRADLEKLETHFPGYPHPNLLRAIEVSFEALGTRERRCFLDLAVFPEGEAIPEAPLAVLWAGDGMELTDVRDQMARFVARSLASSDRSRRWRLHDLLWAYIRKRSKEPERLHCRLADGYAASCGGDFRRGPDDGYFYQSLPYHLLHAERRDELRALLLDFSWLRAKLAAAGVNALIADYELFSGDRELTRLGEALRLSAHTLVGNSAQLAGQLIGRLAGSSEPGLRDLLRQIRERGPGQDVAWLEPLTPMLEAPGGSLISTLEGHRAGVIAVTRIDAQRIASASSDGTLQIWDVARGKALRSIESGTIEGHATCICAIEWLSDFRLVAGSPDGDLHLYDLGTGDLLLRMRGHREAVWAVVPLPPGRVVSASGDRTLRVWHLGTGKTERILAGHTEGVTAVAVLDRRRLVSACAGGNLRVWDTETAETLRVLERPGVRDLASLDAHHVVLALVSGELEIWDVEAGELRGRLEGHRDWVKAVVALDDHRIVTGSADQTVRLWDTSALEQIAILGEHAGDVNAMVALGEGLVISASADKTLRVWGTAIEGGPEHAPGGSPICAIACLDHRSAVVGSESGELEIRDAVTGEILRSLGRQPEAITAIAVADGGLVVSSSLARVRVLRSADGTLVYDRSVGVERGALAVAGRWAVWAESQDPFELTVLDLQTGSVRFLRTGYKNSVTAVAALSERRVVSAQDDGSFKVWDLDSGKNVRSLSLEYWDTRQLTALDEARVLVLTGGSERPHLLNLETGRSSDLGWWQVGHRAEITAVGVLDARYVVSAASDRTLIVWDVEKSGSPAFLRTDTPLIALGCHHDSRQIATVDKAGNVSLLRFHPRSFPNGAKARKDRVLPTEINREAGNRLEKLSGASTPASRTAAAAPPQPKTSIVLKPPLRRLTPPPVATPVPASPPDPLRPLPWLLANAPKLRLDRGRKELHCKIVYYGPGLSGKTTNVQYIYGKTSPEAKGKLISLVGTHDITLYFDYLRLRLRPLRDFDTFLHLYTVPGQTFYHALSKLVLSGTDGVIFVANSQQARLESNIEAIRSLEGILEEYGLDLSRLPYVLQLNMRDTPTALPVEELYRTLSYKREPTFEAVAYQGHGVFASLKAVTRQIFAALRQGWQPGEERIRTT